MKPFALSDAEKLIWAAAYFMEYARLESHGRYDRLRDAKAEDVETIKKQLRDECVQNARMFATETITALRKASREMGG